jgi:hypothetical protein
MRIFTQQMPPQPARRAMTEAAPLKPGVWTLQFGRERLLFSDEPETPSRGARVESRVEDVTREQLHVVVQNGRLFQQHHPEVPVLHDRGRFLLVKVDPDRLTELTEESGTCYSVTPVADEQVVFDERAPAAARAGVPAIQRLVDQLSRATLEADLQKLVAFRTRHSTRPEFGEALQFARTQLNAAGFTTKVQTITVNSRPSKNLIADKKGSASGKRGVVLATAHLDSINSAGGATAPAPGADDNGSGSAGILAIARVFQTHAASHDLRLILFGGEEQGLFGSRHYVATLSAAERKRIRGIVNMDMIGNTNTDERSVLLEGAALSQHVIDKLSDAAGTYTQLRVETSLRPANSDHVPFIDAGLPAVLTIEGADSTNDRVHSERDAITTIDYDLMLEILRMNVAYLAAEAG